MSDPVTSAEEGGKCAPEWRQIERAWRDAGLMEAFLGNGGTNHRLYRFVDAVRSTAESEVSRLAERLAKVEAALRPFAAITPSSFYAPDGSESERYVTILCGRGEEAEFTGAHLRAARAALKEPRDE